MATGKKKSVQPENTEITQVADTTAVEIAAAAVDSAAIAATPEAAAPEVAAAPVEKAKPAPKAKAKPKAAPAPKFRYHTVKKGESLSTIARRYKGVTIADIQRANSIKGTNIRAGQKLKIPNS